MTAFGEEAVIEIANDPACDEWTFSQKIRHALEKETVARGERIAQLVVMPFRQTRLEITDELGATSRGAGGFGHTGRM